jgi:hypothetical protein
MYSYVLTRILKSKVFAFSRMLSVHEKRLQLAGGAFRIQSPHL